MISRLRRFTLATAGFLAVAMPLEAQLRLGTPETIAWIARGTGDAESGCGLTADYAFPDMTLRVEMVGVPAPGGFSFSIKTYSPTTVSPSMRDIWFKSKSIFTLGRFTAGRPNAKGFMESSGLLDRDASQTLFGEMTNGAIEVSFIFDGPLPHSRIPVVFPSPLPDPVARDMRRCIAELLK